MISEIFRYVRSDLLNWDFEKEWNRDEYLRRMRNKRNKCKGRKKKSNRLHISKQVRAKHRKKL